MKRREFLARATAAALVPWRQRSASSELGGLTAELEKQIPSWMSDARVPGLSIALIQDARLVRWQGFGTRDANSNQRVTNDVMFEAASMSKPIFAYVVMKLCETGLMSLDVPLTKYTPERFLVGDSRLDAITARHVLSHTSGFQNWRSEKDPLAIHFAPGTQYRYSGEGYNYLQTVVTRLLGQPFEMYMRTRLFAPLGMDSSRYVWDDVAHRRMARPHGATGVAMENNRSSPDGVARYGSAGALLTTPSDFARFMIAVMEPPPADAFRLKRESVTEMFRPHVKLPSAEFASSWSLGWQLFHNATGDFIHHGGDNRGFHCAAVASVARKCGYVAMTNGENGATVLRNLLVMEPMQRFLTGVVG